MSSIDNLVKLANLLSRSSVLMQFFVNTASEIASMLGKIGKLKAVEVQRDVDGYIAVLEGSNGKLVVKVTIEVHEEVGTEGG